MAVRTYLNAFFMCQSMFCAIPVPLNIWDEKAKDKMLLFLPLLGLEMGLLWWGLSMLTELLALPPLVGGLALCVWPWLVTGGIHLDGYMDVCDATGSCRSLERRREILKDSHVGAFAVMGLGLLMMGQFALLASGGGDGRMLIILPAVSRCCSALAVTALRPMPGSQYAAQKKETAHIWMLAAQLAALLAAGFLLAGKNALCLLGCLAGYGLALRRGYRGLEGMNGDIAGYSLAIGELTGIAVWVLL